MIKKTKISEEHKNTILLLYRDHSIPEILSILYTESGTLYSDQQIYSYVRTFKKTWLKTIEDLESKGHLDEANAAKLKLNEILPSKRAETLNFYQSLINSVIAPDSDSEKSSQSLKGHE
jgi:hypothetical protein